MARQKTRLAEMPESTAAPSSKLRTLLQRALSTAFLVTMVAVAFWLEEPWIFFVIFVVLSLHITCTWRCG